MTTSTRDWTGVRESLRRERQIHDLLARSGSTRLHQRVTTPQHHRDDWRSVERLVVELERAIRLLDVTSPDFWTRYRSLQDSLIGVYRNAGVTFRG